MVVRSFPIRFASSSWWSPNSSVKRLEAFGLLNGVEILPLEVLDEGDLQNLPVLGLLDHDRNFLQSCLLSGPPTPLPHNDSYP